MNVYFDDTSTFTVALAESSITAVFDTTLDMTVVFTEEGGITCSLDSDDDFSVSFGDGVVEGDYTGTYTVTPTTSTQTLVTAGKTLASNIVIEPIPETYGLITWNGSVLTVS